MSSSNRIERGRKTALDVRRCLAAATAGVLIVWGATAGADEAGSKELLGPYCACYQTEPAMDFGGWSVSSIQGLTSGLLERGTNASPSVAPAWEFPVALLMILVQHEVMGHGGRAREFDLDPSYGLDFAGLGAYTTLGRVPNTVEEITLIAAGGSEADTVLAQRLLIDFYRPGGEQGAQAPLLLLSKLDLPLYVLQTASPSDASEFAQQFEQGNDIAIYLVSRQAERMDADPNDVWERQYPIDFADPLLHENYDDVQVTALWTLLDPAVAFSLVAYFNGHVSGGAVKIEPPVWQVAPKLGLTLGTRGFLGPAEVSRYLDVYFVTKRGVGTVFVRDLDSSIDRSYGLGLGFNRLRLGSRLTVDVLGEWWDEPRSLELGIGNEGWHAGAVLNWLVRPRWGFATKLGSKSDGFLPGLPIDDGVYVGFGLLGRF